MKKDNKLKLLLTLFIDYFKIGLISFGGGLAMIPLLSKTFVEKRKYITDEDMLYITTISESTPGVIAINCATYIGYKVMGVIGSIVSTIAVSLPSFIIILILSIFYDRLSEIEIISYILKGLSIAGEFLIFRAAFKLFKTSKKSFINYIIMGLSFLSILMIKFFKLDISSIFIILSGGLVSLIVYLISVIKEKNKNKEEMK